MNNFQIFEDLHTLAHLWARYKADYEEIMPFRYYVFDAEPDKATRLMRIFDFIKNEIGLE